MSIIECPNCDKPVSRRIRLCPYCGFQRGQVNAEVLKETRRRKLRNQLYHIKMASYSVITLFLSGFAWYWIDTKSFRYPSSMAPVILLAVTSVAYLVLRVYLFRSKKALRKLTR